jgi:2,3-bisphosphoglycerate-independent phosphoglycerate mutase
VVHHSTIVSLTSENVVDITIKQLIGNAKEHDFNFIESKSKDEKKYKKKYKKKEKTDSSGNGGMLVLVFLMMFLAAYLFYKFQIS